MRYTYLVLFLLLSFVATAQEPTLGNFNGAYRYKGRLYVDGVLGVPSDVSYSAPLRDGAIRYNPGPGSLQLWKANAWVDVGAPPLSDSIKSIWTQTSGGDRSDYVDRLKSMSAPVVNNYIRYIGSGDAQQIVACGINYADGYTAEYRIRKSTSDLWLLRGIYMGRTILVNPPDVALNGDWNTSAAPSTYTTSAGATFTFQFMGSGFIFKHYSDNRGGIFRFTISETGATKEVSVWRNNAPSTGTSIVRDVIFEGLKYATYTVTATFIGADPNHAPSSGPARGWIRYTPTGKETVDILAIHGVPSGDAVDVVAENTILDFAISARPAEVPSMAFTWIPAHGAVSGSTRSVVTQIVVDSVSLNMSTLTSLEMLTGIHKVSFQQSYTGFNENDVPGNYPLWSGFISHSISREGLEITHKIRMLRDVTTSVGYLAMFAGKMPTANKVIFGVQEYAVARPAAEIQTNLPRAYGSAAVVDDNTISSGFVAGFSTNITDAHQLDRRAYIVGDNYFTQRTDDIAKFYWRFGRNTLHPAGTVYKIRNRFYAARIFDVRAL
ncbi:hypothetical protein KTO58_01285 [Chitinophaga pendula]|uniref:hypothetical protein n=1 Tax=Chitinophaga TaxID=79328 RepID=UPI000BB07CDB|nr:MULTISPECIES: hypothetical protein [Chitinophaga]ASZ14503.1 hypothetical protein CK934_27930 [Chitinophaga sp. MD30]UCJ07839.1 hypothetical protein KTO58_01285 [Chitinophaga pendula]